MHQGNEPDPASINALTPLNPTTSSPNLLLVVPCFNESGRLPSFLRELGKTFCTDSTISILVVDDGSGAEEQARLTAIVEEARKTAECIRPLSICPVNQGKGGAIYAGWAQNIDADWLAFVDADGSCSASEILRLKSKLPSLPETVKALFASRVKMLGRKVDRHLHRHLLGRVYATLVSNLLNVDVYDSQCGLKFVRREAYEAVRDRLTLHRFAFDIDLLTALLDAGYDVREEPIDWHEVAGGKVRLLRDSLQMLRDVLSVRRKRLALREPS